MTLTISHTHAEGTLLDGTARGDGSAEVLKTKVGGWRWSRNVGWYVRNSRDHRANTRHIDATKTALEAAGFTVEVEIDDTYRDTADVEADKIARQEGRAAALDAKADRKAAAAETAWDAERRAVEALPPGGEPIHVGHHSERRHRKAIERSHQAIRKAIDATEEAKAVADRAEAAAHTTERRYRPDVIRRRVDKLEADLRRFQRDRDGHTRTLFTDGRGVKHVETTGAATGDYRDRLLGEITRLEGDIAYWNGELAKAADAGAQLWDATTVTVGDQIGYWGGWDIVTKVNPKSVRLASRRYGTLPFDQIKAVRTADGRTVRIVDGARVVEEVA